MAINHVVLTGTVAEPGPHMTYSASAKPETKFTLSVSDSKGEQVFNLYVPVFVYGTGAERAAAARAEAAGEGGRAGAPAGAGPQGAPMSDRWSMTLADVRVAFSEVIQLYMSAMRAHERPADHKLEAARMAQQALNDYLRLLNITELQAEVEQTQRIVGRLRSDLPGPFDEGEDR